METMRIEINIPNNVLVRLKSLNSEIGKYPYVVLSENEEATLKEFLGIVFEEVGRKEQQELRKHEDQEKVCECGHELGVHASIADRLCCSEGCQCFVFKEKSNGTPKEVV
jgi:hypothetical protein